MGSDRYEGIRRLVETWGRRPFEAECAVRLVAVPRKPLRPIAKEPAVKLAARGQALDRVRGSVCAEREHDLARALDALRPCEETGGRDGGERLPSGGRAGSHEPTEQRLAAERGPRGGPDGTVARRRRPASPQ